MRVVVEQDMAKTLTWGVYIEQRGDPPPRVLWCRYESRDDARRGEAEAGAYITRRRRR